jgi:ubiquinone/menaquinone biosynthesis C-methylase UbiE
MNSSERYQDKTTRSTWDKISQRYDWDNYWLGYDNQANFKVLLSYIGNPKGKAIIEVGCGSGFTSIALAQQGARVTILDMSSESLKIATDGFKRFGLEQPEAYNEDALSSSVPSESFDIVWNGGVIEHFYDDGKEMLLREMYRMAKIGGKVIVTVPNAWCWPFQVAQYVKKLRKTWSYGYEDDMSPMRLRKLCQRLGFSNIETYAYNTVVGWAWLPKIGWPIVYNLGWNTLDRHCQRSWMGFVSILIIDK